LLYLINDEAIVRDTTDNLEAGISVGGRIISTIRYADDKAVVANSQKELQQLMDNPNKVTREFGMKSNMKKTKVMCLSRKGNNKLEIYVDGQQVEQVSQFRYLEDGYCTQEIRYVTVTSLLCKGGIKLYGNKRELVNSKCNAQKSSGSCI